MPTLNTKEELKPFKEEDPQKVVAYLVQALKVVSSCDTLEDVAGLKKGLSLFPDGKEKNIMLATVEALEYVLAD